MAKENNSKHGFSDIEYIFSGVFKMTISCQPMCKILKSHQTILRNDNGNMSIFLI